MMRRSQKKKTHTQSDNILKEHHQLAIGITNTASVHVKQTTSVINFIYLLLQSEIEKTNNEGDRLSLTTVNNTEWCVVQVTFFLFLYATLSYAVYRLKRN